MPMTSMSGLPRRFDPMRPPAPQPAQQCQRCEQHEDQRQAQGAHDAVFDQASGYEMTASPGASVTAMRPIVQKYQRNSSRSPKTRNAPSATTAATMSMAIMAAGP